MRTHTYTHTRTHTNTPAYPCKGRWHPQGHNELNDSSTCLCLSWVPNILLIHQQICTHRGPYTQRAQTHTHTHTHTHTAPRRMLRFGSQYRSTLVSMSSITSTVPESAAASPSGRERQQENSRRERQGNCGVYLCKQKNSLTGEVEWPAISQQTTTRGEYHPEVAASVFTRAASPRGKAS